MDKDLLKARIWMWGPFLLIGVFFVSLTVFSIKYFDLIGSDWNSGEHYPYGSMRDLTLWENLQPAFLKANGGEESLSILQSVRYIGVLNNGEQSIPFTSIKKRPWQSLLTLRFPKFELSYVVDGETVWQRVEAPAKKPIDTLLKGDEAMRIRQMGAFFDPVMTLCLFNEGVIQSLKEGVLDGQPVVVIHFANEDFKLDCKAYIDPKTMHVLSRIDFLEDGTVRRLVYSDHRKVGGMIEPFVTVTHIDGEFDNRVRVERNDHNIGTFPSFFEYPGDEE